MSRRKTCKTFLLVPSLLVTVLLGGCQSEENFPFYQMETREDYSEVLYLDGVQYGRKQYLPEWLRLFPNTTSPPETSDPKAHCRPCSGGGLYPAVCGCTIHDIAWENEKGNQERMG